MARFLLAIALIPLIVQAYQSPGGPVGFVNDFAEMLQSQERQPLEAKLSSFAQESGNEIAIVTIPTLGGDTIENFAVKLFEEWGIGKKEFDNGILLLVARDERAVRIEVGYGLEGALTDAQSYWIIQNVIVPAFSAGNYYVGIDAAVDKIIAATKGEYVPAQTYQPSGGSPFNFNWFFLILFLPLWLASILGRSKSWWAGGVLGGIAGVILGFIYGFVFTGVIGIAVLIPLGLLFDFLVSRAYARGKASGHIPWWIGGGRGHGGFGGGGFGGFGGGSSGGGGASGRW